MGPYTPPSFSTYDSCDTTDTPMQVASNWSPSMLRDIYNGCPSQMPPMRSCFPPLTRPSPCPPRTDDICMTPARDSCKLPPINCMPRRVCNDHPRDDCCMVPSCSPCPMECTPALCVERTPLVKPGVEYIPPSQPFDGCSLYRTQFNGCYGPPACSYKPSNSFDPSTARMSDTSMYREQFTCKPIIPVMSRKPNAEYDPPCSPFEGCSTYRVDFRGCYGSPANSLKPSTTFDPSSGKMDGTSTYRNSYIPYCPAEYQYARAGNVKPDQVPHISCTPFSGCSTYRVDFSPKCALRTPSMKPAGRHGFSSAPFCNRTTYKNDYLPFYFKDCCPDQCIRRCR